MDERLLTEKLVGYDSSGAEGIKHCAGFVKGWLDAREISTRQLEIRGLPVLVADVGARGRAADGAPARPPRRGARATRSSSSPGSRAIGSSAAAPTT